MVDRIGKSPFPVWMAGAGFLLSWGILFFFLAQSGQFAAGCYQADLAYLGCTLLVSVLFAVLALRGVDCHLRSIADIGCVLMIIGTLLTAQVDAGSAGWLASLIAGKAAAGMGLGLLWVAWGALFYRCEIGQVESAFWGGYRYLPYCWSWRFRQRLWILQDYVSISYLCPCLFLRLWRSEGE